MGSLCGGSSTTSSTTSSPQWLQDMYKSTATAAMNQAQTPYQPYSYNPNAYSAPLSGSQVAGEQNINSAAGMAQPFYANATSTLGNYLGAATGTLGQAANTIDAAQNTGAAYNQAGMAGYQGALQSSSPYNQAATMGYASAPGAAAGYNAAASQGYNQASQSAAPFNQMASSGYAAAPGAAAAMNTAATQGYNNALSYASPYNQAATGAIGNALGAGSGYNQNALSNYMGGLAAAQPYTLGGGQAVNATPIDAASIGQYLSPFLNNVYGATLAGENLQNAQQASALQGNAIQAGAFGGDRSGIAQANLAYQQNLANAQTNANLLNTGYANALATAQAQQGVNLGAQQANRTALAATGQNIYNQMSNTGQNIANLGQQVYGQNIGASTALSGLGNQMFGQQAAAAQGFGNIGQQIYGQQIGAAQGLANVGNQIYNQGATSAAGQLAVGNQNYNQAIGAAQGLAGMGNQIYSQDAQAAQAALTAGQNAFNQGATTAAQQAGIGNNLYTMGSNAATTLGSLGGAAQTSALQSGQAQMAAGAIDQAQAQKGLDALVAQQKQAQAFPFTEIGWAANILNGGSGALAGTTTNTSAPTGFLGARGGAMKAPTRATGGLVPNAVSEGGTVSVDRAGQGFAVGGNAMMPDPYMGNMFDILSSIYPNQNTNGVAPQSGGLAPSSGGFAGLSNPNQYAGNPYAALLNTASAINPANYASANKAVTPSTIAGYAGGTYDPASLLAPSTKGTSTPWWTPPAATPDITAAANTMATGSASQSAGSEASMNGTGVGGGDLAGALGLVNGQALVGAGKAFTGLYDETKSGLMDLLGLGSNAPSVLSQQNPFGLDPAQRAQAAKDEETAVDLETTDPAVDPETTDLGMGVNGIGGGGGKGDGGGGDGGGNGNGGGAGGGGGGGGSNSEGPQGEGGGTNAYRGGLIRAHRSTGGGNVGIADALYNQDPNSIAWLYGQSGNSPSSLDQFSNGTGTSTVGSAGGKSQGLLGAAKDINTLVDAGSSIGKIASLVGGFLERGGRVERAGGGLVGRHGYDDGGYISDSDPAQTTDDSPRRLPDAFLRGLLPGHSVAQQITGQTAVPTGNATPSITPQNIDMGTVTNTDGAASPPLSPAQKLGSASDSDLEYYKRMARRKNQSMLLTGSVPDWLNSAAPYTIEDIVGEQGVRGWLKPALQKIDTSKPLAGGQSGDTVSSFGNQEPEKEAAMARALAIAGNAVSPAPSTTAPYMNPDYPEAPVVRADVAGGLVPTARENPREGVYRPYAAPAVAGQQYDPQQGGTAPDSTDVIRFQNTGPNAPVGRGGDGTAASFGGGSYTPLAAAPVAAPSKGLMPSAAPGDQTSEAPKGGSWIDRNRDLLNNISLIGGALSGMVGKRSVLGAIAGGVSGAGAASQAVQKAIADRAKTEAETVNMPARLAVDTRTQDQALLTSLLQKRSMFALAPGPELDLLNQQINTLIAKIGSQATPGTPTAIMPTGQTQPGAAPGVSGAGGASIPLTIRANNPGAIKDGSFAQSQPGYVGTDGPFARFDTPENGHRAMGNLLQTGYFGKGINTVEGIIRRWATEDPQSADDKRKVDNYVSTVAAQLGVKPTDQIDPQDANRIRQLQNAMASYESGRPVSNQSNFATPGATQTTAAPAQATPQTQQAASAGAAPHGMQAIGTAAVQVPPEVAAVLNNPELTRFVPTAVSQGYNDGANPLLMIQRGNAAAATGNPTMALDLWKSAASEINRMNETGTFMGNDGKSHIVPGWLDTTAQKAQVAANRDYFTKLAENQSKRSASEGVIGQVGDTLARHETGSRMEAQARAEGILRGLGVAPQHLTGAKSALEILQKEASNTAARVGGDSTDLGRTLALQSTVQGKNDPEANQTLYAQLKATNAYENMRDQAAMVMAAQSDRKGIPFDPATFARQWELQNPGLMHRLVEESRKTSPVRGVPLSQNAPDGSQFVAEPKTLFNRSNQNPWVVQVRDGKVYPVRELAN